MRRIVVARLRQLRLGDVSVLVDGRVSWNEFSETSALDLVEERNSRARRIYIRCAAHVDDLHLTRPST